MSNQNDQQSLSGDFVEKRRAALERYMIRTAAHPVLCVDPDFREFLECGMSKAICFKQAVLCRFVIISHLLALFSFTVSRG